VDIKQKFKRSFAFNLGVVIGLLALLYILFFTSLSFVTRHGKEIKMPKVTGRDVRLAEKELEKLDFDVDIDSAYDPKQRPFVVLSQMPDVNAVVKRGRTVFLTINKAEAPLTPMPNLLNLSFRSAEMILRSNKLALGDTSYRPDIAKGAILEQLYRGQPIRPGSLIPQGSRVDLVIGDGLGDTEFDVPDVVGMGYNEAIAVINANGLNFTTIWEGEITDSATATVYVQYPKSRNELMEQNRIKEGDIVDIRVKQNPSAEDYGDNINVTDSVNDTE
jgi:eukaryotic-like serine/threonine-protein kinase